MTFDEYLYAVYLDRKGFLNEAQRKQLREFEDLCRKVVATLELVA